MREEQDMTNSCHRKHSRTDGWGGFEGRLANRTQEPKWSDEMTLIIHCNLGLFLRAKDNSPAEGQQRMEGEGLGPTRVGAVNKCSHLGFS